jgi:hypothetical protein
MALKILRPKEFRLFLQDQLSKGPMTEDQLFGQVRAAGYWTNQGTFYDRLSRAVRGKAIAKVKIRGTNYYIRRDDARYRILSDYLEETPSPDRKMIESIILR